MRCLILDTQRRLPSPGWQNMTLMNILRKFISYTERAVSAPRVSPDGMHLALSRATRRSGLGAAPPLMSPTWRRAQTWSTRGGGQPPYGGRGPMIHQGPPVSCTCTPPPPHRLGAGSRSTAEGPDAPTGGEPQPRDRCWPASPPTCAYRIAHLRHAVACGHYRVSAEQIAENMVHEALVALLASGPWRA
jgi:Anti-sigma-28 factor, FlgM